MVDSHRRIVFDTNIFIQAFLNPEGPSGECFRLVREQDILLFISEHSLSEVEEVIDRPGLRSMVRFDYE